MGILTVLIIFLVAINVSCRSIFKPDLNDRADDDIDLEEELDLYYEKLLNEFMALAKELETERERAENDAQERGRQMKMNMMADVKRVEAKIKSDFDGTDYDYMSDGVPQQATATVKIDNKYLLLLPITQLAVCTKNVFCVDCVQKTFL